MRRKRVLSRDDFRRARNYYPPEYPEKVLGFWCILSYCKEAGIRGEIVECGVGRGVSFFLLGLWANHLGLERNLYGFDSFEGFPEPSPEDASYRQPRRGEWSDTSVEHVRKHFEVAGLSDYWLRHVKIVEGFFQETLRHTDIPQISFLHLDCDLYHSYRVAIEVLGPRVTWGGVVLYDEYGSPKFPGATKAVGELLPSLGHRLFFSRLLDSYVSVEREVALRPSPELIRLWRSLDVSET